jgi:hypothetical protein
MRHFIATPYCFSWPLPLRDASAADAFADEPIFSLRQRQAPDASHAAFIMPDAFRCATISAIEFFRLAADYCR